MPADYRTVRLMKNRLYPTYQLHAVMEARKTTPEDGLKIGVLTILDWLRHRLGPDAPETLTAPQPERYADFSWENLRSLYINQGYVIDIVSLPEQGAWTMQIVEPDLGSDPGNPEQRRQAVPGRVIESNIAFTISNGELHCGFRTMISDPEDTEELCEVYRPAFIRLLADNPRFGLRQIAPLTPSVTRVETMEQLRQLASLQKNPASHMPLILFTQTLEEREITPLDIAPHDVPPDLRISSSFSFSSRRRYCFARSSCSVRRIFSSSSAEILLLYAAASCSSLCLNLSSAASLSRSAFCAAARSRAFACTTNRQGDSVISRPRA